MWVLTMDKQHNIRFLYDESTGIELIICKNSTLSYSLHNHISVFTIGIILEGAILLMTDRCSRTYGKKQTFVIPPYMPHCMQAQGSYTMLSLCIDKEMVYLENLDNIRAEIIRSLKNVSSFQTPIFRQVVQGLNCLNMNYKYSSNCRDTYIYKLKNQIEQYPEDKICIDEMAQSALISKYHFIRSFKQEVGLTPHQFQLQNRVRKAKQLLIQSDSATEVALATGFCDQSHFIKNFRKIVGLTPTQYKLSYDMINSEFLT